MRRMTQGRQPFRASRASGSGQFDGDKVAVPITTSEIDALRGMVQTCEQMNRAIENLQRELAQDRHVDCPNCKTRITVPGKQVNESAGLRGELDRCRAGVQAILSKCDAPNGATLWFE